MKVLEFCNKNQFIIGVKGKQLIVSSLASDNELEVGEDVTYRYFSDEKEEVVFNFSELSSLDVLMIQLDKIRSRLFDEEENKKINDFFAALHDANNLDDLISFCNTGKYPN